MSPILQVFYSLFSGMMLSAAIPNEIYLLGNPLIAFAALFPYYIAIKNCKSYRLAFALGFIQSITTHLLSSFWLAFFKDFAALTLGASAVGTGFIGGFMALLLYMPFSSSSDRNILNAFSLFNTRKPSFRIFYFAALWTLYEWVKSSGFLGYPWGTISSCMFNFRAFTQIADITGTYGISFLTAFFNAMAAEIFSSWILFRNTESSSKKTVHFNLKWTVKTFSVFMILSLAYGTIQCSLNRRPQKFLKTIMVQQNSDPWKKNSDTETILLCQRLTENELNKAAYEEKSQHDLIVWCEGSLNYMFPQNYSYYKSAPAEKPLVSFIKNNRIPLLTGGSYMKDREKEIYHNSALLFDSEGNFRGHYGKNHLVPMAESIPGIEYPKIKAIMKKIIGISAGWSPGDQYVLFNVPCKYADEYDLPETAVIDLSESYDAQKKRETQKPFVKIAAPICYDDAFTDIMRPLFLNGAELFINLTDDSWSCRKSSEYQHFTVASYRAIEYRTTLVRACNAGYSVVLDPTGKILADMPLFEEASITCNVPVYKRKMTVYARYGNWLPYTLIVFFFLSAFRTYILFEPTDFIQSERKQKDRKKKDKENKKSKKDKKKKPHND